MKRIVVLISGRGSNMAAIADACTREAWPARVVAVVSSRADAAGLAAARERDLPTATLEPAGFPSRDAYDAALADTVDGFDADVVVLAGFMRILSDGFVRRYDGRLVNIHPSLLPAFPGLHTHARAIAAGCKWTGATVHLVTPTLDGGPIVAQAAVPVRPDDTPASLAERVRAAEHRIYPRAVRWLVDGALTVEAGIVRHAHGEPQQLVFDDGEILLTAGSPRC